jgi:hypothetical protein
LIRLTGGKAGRDHRQPHRLFLKNRHPHGFFQHTPHRITRIRDLLFATTAA